MKKEDEILEIIIENLKQSNLVLYNQNNDGRVDSANTEKIILDFIINNEKITSYLRQNNLYAKIPSIREWYDLLIHSNNDDIYCPINIKLSNLLEMII